MNPLSQHEQTRLAALHALQVLDTAPEAHFDAVCRTASRLFSVPITLVPLIDSDRQWFKARCGIELKETSREVAFCARTILSDDVFVVEDATQDEHFRDNPLVTGKPSIRFYAGAPLILRPGIRVGTLCIIDTKPRTFTQEDRGALADLAEIVVAHLRLHKARQDAERNESIIREREALLNGTLENMDQGLLMVDASGIVQVHNRRAIELLDLPVEMMAAKPSFDAVRRYQVERGEFAGVDQRLASVVQAQGLIVPNYCYERTRPNGTILEVRTVPLRDGGVVRTFTDVTERKRAERDLWRAANEDLLTGLPNRALFQRRLDEALADAARRVARVNLLVIDLDAFKDVNDTLGHDAGDALLIETARRLAAVAGPQDTVARLGGDEFAFILGKGEHDASALVRARAILDKLSEPFTFGDRVLPIRASIGVATYPDHHQNARELLKDADLALYRAKATGRNRAAVYEPLLREETEKRVHVAREIEAAVRKRQVVPFYQPKLSLKTGVVVGFEALARWQHPSRGVLTPGYFGSVFEDAELARAVGASLFEQIVCDMRGWLDRGIPFGRVAVNLAAAEFADPQLAGRILATLAEHRVPSDLLEVEVTETVLLGRSAEAVMAILERFHFAGVRVAFDDFGTGFASLTHLKRFPVDHIKIDQSFVRDLEHDEDDAAIVAAVVGLGRSLGLEVTAEGVETKGQAERLRLWGCDNAQGYLYAKPLVGSRVPWVVRQFAESGSDTSQRRSG